MMSQYLCHIDVAITLLPPELVPGSFMGGFRVKGRGGGVENPDENCPKDVENQKEYLFCKLISGKKNAEGLCLHPPHPSNLWKEVNSSKLCLLARFEPKE